MNRIARRILFEVESRFGGGQCAFVGNSALNFSRRMSSAFLIIRSPTKRLYRKWAISTHFVVALVFLPVLTMSGVQGRLFGPLAIAYILAIFASLLIALALTPGLSAALLPQTIERAHDTRFIAMLKKRYQRFMRRVLKRPGPLLASAGILCLAALAAIPFFGGECPPYPAPRFAKPCALAMHSRAS